MIKIQEDMIEAINQGKISTYKGTPHGLLYNFNRNKIPTTAEFVDHALLKQVNDDLKTIQLAQTLKEQYEKAGVKF